MIVLCAQSENCDIWKPLQEGYNVLFNDEQHRVTGCAIIDNKFCGILNDSSSELQEILVNYQQIMRYDDHKVNINDKCYTVSSCLNKFAICYNCCTNETKNVYSGDTVKELNGDVTLGNVILLDVPLMAKDKVRVVRQTNPSVVIQIPIENLVIEDNKGISYTLCIF